MPAAPCRVAPCATLHEKTSQWFARASAALLNQVPCHAGCCDCCVGVFPVTILDHAAIQAGLQTLPDGVRNTILANAAAQTATMTTAYPALAATPILDEWPDQLLDQLAAQFADLPCPALDAHGHCAIYAFRPLTCRSMGIPPEEHGMVTGACVRQIAVPIIRLSEVLRREEDQLAEDEARHLTVLQQAHPDRGEELPLPFAFLPHDTPERK